MRTQNIRKGRRKRSKCLSKPGKTNKETAQGQREKQERRKMKRGKSNLRRRAKQAANNKRRNRRKRSQSTKSGMADADVINCDEIAEGRRKERTRQVE
jgi:hypothetical protein